MNFSLVYYETVLVILCVVFVNGIVIGNEIGDNDNSTETSIDAVARSGKEINTSQGTSSGKKDSSTKRGLESSMAYPQGYFPPYHSSNEMHPPVTPPYNRDYEQELNKKGILYFERPLSTGPVLVTQRTAGRRPPLVSNLRPTFNPNNGYFVPTQSYPNDQSTFKNDDRPYTFPTSDASYSEISHRPSQNTQPVGYPENYPSYMYLNDPRRTYTIPTPSEGSSSEVGNRPAQNSQPVAGYTENYSSYNVYANDPRRTYPIQTPSDPSPYENQRGQGGIDYENGYTGVPRPIYNPNQQTYVNYGQERQPVEETHRYSNEQPQNDRKWELQYQIQVLRELEEQKRRLLQEINSQTQASPAYYPTGTGSIHRRMVSSQYPIDLVQSQSQPSEAARRRGTTFLMERAYHQPGMPTRMPYSIGDQRLLRNPHGRNFDVAGTLGNYMMPKNKRQMERLAPSCVQAAGPGEAGNVVCGTAKSPIQFGNGPFLDYIEHQSLKHLIYRPAGTPPAYPPMGSPPIIVPDALPCEEDSMSNGIPETGRPSGINGGNWGPGGTGPIPPGDGSWGGQVSVPQLCAGGMICNGHPETSGVHVGNSGPGGSLTPGETGPIPGDYGTSIDHRPIQTNCPYGKCNVHPATDSVVDEGNFGPGGNLTPGGTGPISGEHGSSIDHRPTHTNCVVWADGVICNGHPDTSGDHVGNLGPGGNLTPGGTGPVPEDQETSIDHQPTQTNCPDGIVCNGYPGADSGVHSGNLGPGGNVAPGGTGPITGDHGTSIDHRPTQTNCADGIRCDENPGTDSVVDGGNVGPGGSAEISGGDDSSGDIKPTTRPHCEDGTSCDEESGMDSDHDDGSLRPVSTGPVSGGSDTSSDNRPSQHFNTDCGNSSKVDDKKENEHTESQLDLISFPSPAIEEERDKDFFNKLISSIDPRSIRV